MNHRFGCTKPSFFFFPRNPEEKTLWRLRDPLVPLRHNHLSLLFFPLLSLSFRVFCNFLTINPQSPPYPVLCFGILGFFFFGSFLYHHFQPFSFALYPCFCLSEIYLYGYCCFTSFYRSYPYYCISYGFSVFFLFCLPFS